MVSHEFRTPLGIIQSSAEILQYYLDQLEPAERNEHLQSIRKNTRRMALLMEEVLFLGGLDAGKMEFKTAPLELRTFMQRLVDEILSANNRRCPIELSFSEMPAEIQADERLLRHIFTNLLSNAIKYSDAGRVVQFEIGRAGAEFVCVIRDQGIGIPEADREWLFDAFHRGHNVCDRPGTGLGLVIVKRCVDLHGGTIKVESKLGEGTVVTVRLEWREDKAHLGCSFSTCDSFDGVEENLLANSSHLVDEFFKLSMVVNGSTKKFGLFVGKGDCHGLGFDFSRPAPVALWAFAQAALSHPIER
jgi:signal transduction histidine kinase